MLLKGKGRGRGRGRGSLVQAPKDQRPKGALYYSSRLLLPVNPLFSILAHFLCSVPVPVSPFFSLCSTSPVSMNPPCVLVDARFGIRTRWNTAQRTNIDTGCMQRTGGGCVCTCVERRLELSGTQAPICFVLIFSFLLLSFLVLAPPFPTPWRPGQLELSMCIPTDFEACTFFLVVFLFLFLFLFFNPFFTLPPGHVYTWRIHLQSQPILSEQ